MPEQLALKHRSGKHTSHSAKHKHQPSTATATDKKKDNKSGGSSCKPGKGSRKTSSSKWEEARKRQKESTEPDVKESTQPDIMAQKQALEDEVMARKDRKSKLKKEQAALEAEPVALDSGVPLGPNVGLRLPSPHPTPPRMAFPQIYWAFPFTGRFPKR